jgi:MoxR-like ATPase
MTPPDMTTDVAQIAERIQEKIPAVERARAALQKVVVGQKDLVDGLFLALLADGHVLLEGLPGLAKSLAVASLAQAFDADYRRMQFTPDLMPSDILGTQVFDMQKGEWSIRRGPVFANFLLADEINRAPAKVQSALLEAMQERQVSLAGETQRLPDPFLVLATQNPVEQEGTYPLPEAQVDRFLLKIVVGYPDRDEEIEIIDRMGGSTAPPRVEAAATLDDLRALRDLVPTVFLDDKVKRFIVDLVFATREPRSVGLEDLESLILYGASPRASLALTRCARARAVLQGRGYVTPQDVKAVAMPVMRHRVVPTYEAEAEELTSENLLDRILDRVPVP